MIAIGFVFLLDTGELVEWISRNRETKLDEVIAVAILFPFDFVRIFRSADGSGSLSNSPVIQKKSHLTSSIAPRRGLRRDITGIVIALAVSVVLVFLFDTGWLIEWLAQHKSTKLDEIIVVSVVLLIGLSFFRCAVPSNSPITCRKFRSCTKRRSFSIAGPP